MDKNYWVISMVTEEKNYAQQALAGGFVGLVWREVSLDLSPFVNVERPVFIEQAYNIFAKAYPSRNEASVLNAMRQLYRFVNVVQPDDLIFLRDTENGVFHIGKIESA